MTHEQYKEEIAAIHRLRDEFRKNPEAARKFLIKCKIITPGGRLAQKFRRYPSQLRSRLPRLRPGGGRKDLAVCKF